jgi:hypothetical protein
VPIYFGSICINAATGNGWSENFYVDRADYNAALLDLAGLASARAAFLAQGYRVIASRVSDVGVRGDSALDFPTYTPAGDSLDNRPDSPWAAAQFKISHANLYRRFFMMRGFKDSTLTYDGAGELIQTAIITNALTALNSKLVNTAFRLRCVDKEPPNANPIQVISLTANGAGWTVCTMNPLGVTAPGEIRLAGFNPDDPRDKRFVNRSWKVIKVEPGSCTINLPFDQIIDPSSVGGGFLIRKVIVYKPITAVSFYGKGHHDTGRGFFVSRGRRRARR